METVHLGRDRSIFNILYYAEGNQVLFQVEYPDSSIDKKPVIFQYEEGEWVEHLDELIA